MKTEIFKKLIKEVVKEAIQEELKDILIEAVKSPKTPTISENISPQEGKKSYSNMRDKYMEVLGETSLSFNTRDLSTFNPQTLDPINGNLGGGDVGLDQIMNLLNPK
jgi:hypothetical protein